MKCINKKLFYKYYNYNLTKNNKILKYSSSVKF